MKKLSLYFKVVINGMFLIDFASTKQFEGLFLFVKSNADIAAILYANSGTSKDNLSRDVFALNYCLLFPCRAYLEKMEKWDHQDNQ